MKKRMLALLAILLASVSLFASVVMYDGLTDNGAEVYKVYPGDDYAITAYVIVPMDIELEHLVMVPHKNGRVDPSYGLKDSKVKMFAYQEAEQEYGKDCVILLPVIPEFSNSFRHLEMDRETLLSYDEFAHIDRQVVSLIDDVLDFLDEELDVQLSDKIDIVGYSGEANFALRFSILHPARVWAVCAGGSSWSPSMAARRLMGTRLKYPLGVYDIDKYSDDFDLDAWRHIRFFVDMGMRDDRGSYNYPLFEEVNWAWGGPYEEIWKNFQKAFVNLTDNAEMVSFYELGHEPSSGAYEQFLRLNDDEDKPFTVINPSDACHVLTSKLSYDLENSYNFFYYSPEMTHCAYCDSDVFYNDKNYHYICENGHRNDVHMDKFIAGVYETEKPFLNYGKITFLYPPDHYDGRGKRVIFETGNNPEMWSHGLGDGCLWAGYENFEISIREFGPDWMKCDIDTNGKLYEGISFKRITE